LKDNNAKEAKKAQEEKASPQASKSGGANDSIDKQSDFHPIDKGLNSVPSTSQVPPSASVK